MAERRKIESVGTDTERTVGHRAIDFKWNPKPGIRFRLAHLLVLVTGCGIAIFLLEIWSSESAIIEIQPRWECASA